MLKETINNFLNKWQLGKATNSSEVPVSPQFNLTKITGTIASTIRSKPSANIDFYGYLRTREDKHSLEQCERTKCKDCETPVIFKIKDPNCDGTHHLFGEICWIKPEIKKGDKVQLEGKFEAIIKSKKSHRPSLLVRLIRL